METSRKIHKKHGAKLDSIESILATKAVKKYYQRESKQIVQAIDIIKIDDVSVQVSSKFVCNNNNNEKVLNTSSSNLISFDSMQNKIARVLG